MTCHDVLTHFLASLLKGPVLSALPLDLLFETIIGPTIFLTFKTIQKYFKLLIQIGLIKRLRSTRQATDVLFDKLLSCINCSQAENENVVYKRGYFVLLHA